MILFRWCIFGENTQKGGTVFSSVPHSRRYTMPLCLLASDVHFHHLVKMVSARFLHGKGNFLWSPRYYIFILFLIDDACLNYYHGECQVLIFYTMMNAKSWSSLILLLLVDILLYLLIYVRIDPWILILFNGSCLSFF